MKYLFKLTEAEFDKLTNEEIHSYMITQGGYTEDELKAYVNKQLKLIRIKEKTTMQTLWKNENFWGVVLLVAIVAALLFGG